MSESAGVRAAPRRRGAGLYRGEAWRQHAMKTSATSPGLQHDGGRSNLTRVWELVCTQA